MEVIRKNHNDAKRNLIQSVSKEGEHILDVGCGFGGDLQKWHKCGVNINMCDPEPSALEEARSRAKNMHMRVNFYEWCFKNNFFRVWNDTYKKSTRFYPLFYFANRTEK